MAKQQYLESWLCLNGCAENAKAQRRINGEMSAIPSANVS